MRRALTQVRGRTGVAVLAAVLLVGGCTSGDEGSGDDERTTAPQTGPTDPSAALTPVPPPSGAGDLEAVPGQERPTLEPQPLDQPADLGEGVTVRVVDVEGVDVTGQGPGELSGPALAVTVELANGADAPLDVAGLAVSLAYGDTEAGPVSAEPAAPVQGPVKAGATVEGTYVFMVPADQRSSVLVRVGAAASQPVALFSGAATD